MLTALASKTQAQTRTGLLLLALTALLAVACSGASENEANSTPTEQTGSRPTPTATGPASLPSSNPTSTAQVNVTPTNVSGAPAATLTPPTASISVVPTPTSTPRPVFNAAPQEPLDELVLYTQGQLQPRTGTQSWNDPQPDPESDVVTHEGFNVLSKDLFISGNAGEFMSIYADSRVDVSQFTHVRFTAQSVGSDGDSWIHLSMASEPWASADMRTELRIPAFEWDTFTVPLDLLASSDVPNGYAGLAFIGAPRPDEGTSNEVAFADIRIVRLPDAEPPLALTAVDVSATRVRIKFSEELNEASAVAPESYTILSSDDPNFTEGITPTKATLLPSRKSVELELSRPLADSARYAVEVRGIRDFNGNSIAQTTLGLRVDIREAALRINAGVDINPFSSNIRGVTMSASSWIWSDIVGLESPKRAALIEATRRIRPGVIRFAGGLWVNTTGWDRNGIAIDEGRWRFTDAQSGETYDYLHRYSSEMIDSYALFAQQVGARTIIQVNICDNNPVMWADLLKYTNIEHNYGFQYWELGSELDRDQCIDEEEYASRFVNYSNALKSVDSSIKVLGPSPSMPQFTTWFDALYEQPGVDIDALAFHWYQLTEWTDNTDAPKYQSGSIDALLSYNTAVGTFCQNGFGCPGDVIDPLRLDQNSFRRAMAETVSQRVFTEYLDRFPQGETALTELGAHASDNERPVNGNHTGAIWLADMLARWAYNGLDILTYNSLEDGTNAVGVSRGLLGINGASLIDVRPTFFTEWLYANHFGDMMVQSSTSDAEQKVVAWASRDSADPRALKLILINLSGERARASIEISGFVPFDGEAYVLSSSDPASQDNPGSFASHESSINGVRIPDVTVGDPSAFTNAIDSIQPLDISVGPEFTYELEPYSVVAITLR